MDQASILAGRPTAPFTVGILSRQWGTVGILNILWAYCGHIVYTVGTLWVCYRVTVVYTGHVWHTVGAMWACSPYCEDTMGIDILCVHCKHVGHVVKTMWANCERHSLNFEYSSDLHTYYQFRFCYTMYIVYC